MISLAVQDVYDTYWGKYVHDVTVEHATIGWKKEILERIIGEKNKVFLTWLVSFMYAAKFSLKSLAAWLHYN